MADATPTGGICPTSTHSKKLSRRAALPIIVKVIAAASAVFPIAVASARPRESFMVYVYQTERFKKSEDEADRVDALRKFIEAYGYKVERLS